MDPSFSSPVPQQRSLSWNPHQDAPMQRTPIRSASDRGSSLRRLSINTLMKQSTAAQIYYHDDIPPYLFVTSDHKQKETFRHRVEADAAAGGAAGTSSSTTQSVLKRVSSFSLISRVSSMPQVSSMASLHQDGQSGSKKSANAAKKILAESISSSNLTSNYASKDNLTTGLKNINSSASLVGTSPFANSANGVSASKDPNAPSTFGTAPGTLPSWRLRDRMKTVGVGLVMALNVGTDPPDIIKPHPCAKLQCWMDPASVTRNKAKEKIGERLEAQYARWQQQRAARPLKYRRALDPTVEDVRALCLWLRRQARHERILLHYNGHGVPCPTNNGEIWVFDKNHTEYIPLSVSDLRQWMGKPSIVVLDCSSAGVLIPFLTCPVTETPPTTPPRPSHQQQEQQQTQQQTQQQQQTQAKPPQPIDMETAASHWVKDTIVLCPTSDREWLPMHPDYPADIFTSCLTTPIQIALRWFVRRNRPSMGGLNPEAVDAIPGQANDRKSPLGELNWIFTAVTDSIAWNVLPKPLFQRLFRQDLLVASMFRNFLLADRILRSLNCTPQSYPPLPPGIADHPLWQAWDLACETCIFGLLKDGILGNHVVVKTQAPSSSSGNSTGGVVSGHDDSSSTTPPTQPQQQPQQQSKLQGPSGQPLQSQRQMQQQPQPTTGPASSISSPFFSEQLTAFEIWLEYAATHKDQIESMASPEQLPVVLQVLLSQVHRIRALELLRRFLELGSWAVNLSLSLGIFPYVMKLLQSPEYKPLLVNIWASILKFDASCQVDLVKDGAVPHFIQPLTTWTGLDASKQRTLSAFSLAATCYRYPQAQTECLRQNLHGHCCALLTTHLKLREQQKQQHTSPTNNPLLPPDPIQSQLLSPDAQVWLCICLGNLVNMFPPAQREALHVNAHVCLLSVLREKEAEVRASAAFALGSMLAYMPEPPLPPMNMGGGGGGPTFPPGLTAPPGLALPSQSFTPGASGPQSFLVPQHMTASTMTVPAALTASAVLSGRLQPGMGTNMGAPPAGPRPGGLGGNAVAGNNPQMWQQGLTQPQQQKGPLLAQQMSQQLPIPQLQLQSQLQGALPPQLQLQLQPQQLQPHQIPLQPQQGVQPTQLQPMALPPPQQQPPQMRSQQMGVIVPPGGGPMTTPNAAPLPPGLRLPGGGQALPPQGGTLLPQQNLLRPMGGVPPPSHTGNRLMPGMVHGGGPPHLNVMSLPGHPAMGDANGPGGGLLGAPLRPLMGGGVGLGVGGPTLGGLPQANFPPGFGPGPGGPMLNPMGGPAPRPSMMDPNNRRRPTLYEDRQRLEFDLCIAEGLVKALTDGSSAVRYETVMALSNFLGKYARAFLIVAEKSSIGRGAVDVGEAGAGAALNQSPSHGGSQQDGSSMNQGAESTTVPIPRGLSNNSVLLDRFGACWKALRKVQHEDAHPKISQAANTLVSVIHEQLLDIRMEKEKEREEMQKQKQQQQQQQVGLSGIDEEEGHGGNTERTSSPKEQQQYMIASPDGRERADRDNAPRSDGPLHRLTGKNYPLRRTASELQTADLSKSRNILKPLHGAPVLLDPIGGGGGGSPVTRQEHAAKKKEYKLPKSEFYTWKRGTFKANQDDPDDDELEELDPLNPAGAERAYQQRRNLAVQETGRKLANHFVGLKPKPPKSNQALDLLLDSDEEAEDKVSSLKGDLKMRESRVLKNGDVKMTSMLKFHSYEDALMVCDDEDRISIWDYEKGICSLSYRNGNPKGSRMTTAFWINESSTSLFFVGSDDGSAKVWKGIVERNGDITTQAPSLCAAFFPVPNMKAGQRGSGLICEWQQFSGSLIAGGNTNSIRIWDLSVEQCSTVLETNTDACVTALSTAWDEELGLMPSSYQGMGPDIVVAGQSDGLLKVFDIRAGNSSGGTAEVASTVNKSTGRQRHRSSFGGHRSWIVDTSFTNYGGRSEIISGSVAGDIRSWDLRMSSSLRTLDVQRSTMTALSVHKQIPIAVTGSDARFIKILTLEGETLQVVRMHEEFKSGQARIGPVSCLEFHKQKLILAAGATNSLVSIYKPKHPPTY